MSGGGRPARGIIPVASSGSWRSWDFSSAPPWVDCSGPASWVPRAARAREPTSARAKAPSPTSTKEHAMTAEEPSATARALVACGKGILAADESTGTIAKRFKSVGVASTEENRARHRELLITSKGRECIHQRGDSVRRDDPPAGHRRHAFSELLGRQDVIPGIMVNKGTVDMAGFPARSSPRAWTACGKGSPSTTSWARGSPSGARSSPSATASQPTPASTPTPRRSPGSPRCRRSRDWFRSSSQRC
jgi:hypothetical protein